MKKGKLVVISGFSGSGKGTVVKEILNKYFDKYRLSISATTRQPRTGEEEGREYFFLTKECFEDMIKNDEFIEHAKYVSNYYGTPKKYVQEQLEKGYNVILEIEIQGALNVKKQFPDALLIFLTPPKFEILKERLVSRNTEDMDTISKRLSRAVEESDYMKYYDYMVINESVDVCADEIDSIICKEQDKAIIIEEYVRNFKEDYYDLKKGEC